MYHVHTSYTAWINIFNRNELNDNKCKLWEWLFVTMTLECQLFTIIFFSWKRLQKPIYCKFNAQICMMSTIQEHVGHCSVKNSHILGWFPLLIYLLFSLLLVLILKNIASLFNKVGYFKDFKIVIHICRWQLPVYFEYSVLLSYALSRSRRKYIGTHKTYSVNEQPWLQKQIISSMANVQWRTLWWLIAQDS